MVITNVWAVWYPPESVTMTLKVLEPLVVGVPLIWPVAVLKLSPAGRLPPINDHV